ncbi:MAG: methyltransferase [Oscillospiraceae bacterium]|nr:methyltransferase [Oscillospiraceae bacterium]
MTSKERVYAAINHIKPDRTPRFVWLGAGTAKNLCERLGISPLELQIKIGNDILQTWLSINGEMERDVPQGAEFTDEWGITWKRDGYYNMVVNHPLQGKDADFIKNYNLPDPLRGDRFAYFDFLKREYGNEYFIGADVSGVLFEPACHLRGMENVMMDLAYGDGAIDILLDRLMGFCVTLSKECIKRGADWVWLGDDLGSQKGLMMSPDMWRQYFKPRMKRIIGELRACKNDVIIAYHSCGSMHPVIAGLAEIGVNVLNPIQESAAGMDQERIKKEFGDKLTLMCGLDTQQFLINASAEEIKRKTAEKTEKLGYDGGFILAASHSIQPDTPLENIEAFVDYAGTLL